MLTRLMALSLAGAMPALLSVVPVAPEPQPAPASPAATPGIHEAAVERLRERAMAVV